MDYHILVKGTKIASFLNEMDRDTCLDALLEKHNDVPDDYFTTQDDC